MTLGTSRSLRTLLVLGLTAAAALSACGGGGDAVVAPVPVSVADNSAQLPQLSAATASTFTGDCTTIPASLTSLANTTITTAVTVPAGTVSSVATAEHCRLVGAMNQRISAVDGNNYAIGFEIRMPKAWNGRFFYQANGGTDGNIGTASGGVGGAGARATALSMGFAVLSSDAGHSGGTPYFGLDPQARLDYGYNAVAQLTPMAKDLIKAVYGKAPDRSYLGGCSNGGRHAFVAASRYADMYDGILAGDAGFDLPQAAVAQLWGVQQYATISTGSVTSTVASGTGTAVQTFPDVSTSFTPGERALVGNAILAKCDALDGASDGIISNPQACQAAFKLSRDVPTCAGGPNARDGSTCLSFNQKQVLSNIYAGAKNSSGDSLYVDWPWDNGISGAGWASWKFVNSTGLARDPGATAFIFTTTPLTTTSTFSGIQYAMNFNFDLDAPKIFATDSLYTVAPMTFMTPPDPTNLSKLKNRGAKMMVFHGVADPVFSFNDTAKWYAGLQKNNGGDASNFARMYAVPGMNHCSGGPATDSFDMLTPLVAWVEQGTAPESVVATARGAGNTAVTSTNSEVPAGWSNNRSRPLCSWPKTAKYKGSGDLENAANFSCQ